MNNDIANGLLIEYLFKGKGSEELCENDQDILNSMANAILTGKGAICPASTIERFKTGDMQCEAFYFLTVEESGIDRYRISLSRENKEKIIESILPTIIEAGISSLRGKIRLYEKQAELAKHMVFAIEQL